MIISALMVLSYAAPVASPADIVDVIAADPLDEVETAIEPLVEVDSLPLTEAVDETVDEVVDEAVDEVVTIPDTLVEVGETVENVGEKVSIADTVKEILDNIPIDLVKGAFDYLKGNDGVAIPHIPDLDVNPHLPYVGTSHDIIVDPFLPTYPVEPPCESEVVSPHIPVEPIEKPYEVVEPVVVETPYEAVEPVVVKTPYEVVEPVVVETSCEDEVFSPDVIETAPADYKPYAVSTPNPTPLPEDEDISGILESGASQRNYFLVAISALTLLL
jgi:hypothetical protein